ncbi:MAG: hypothetical protein ISR65_15480 [Bacteriovoracaceae bacterium]|nr:hypothetical protein [Bacteriovoracaceae bacterium]
MDITKAQECIAKVDIKQAGPQMKAADEAENVDLSSLSHLVGFPTEYIKKELSLSENTLPMSELRKKMISYLEKVANSP